MHAWRRAGGFSLVELLISLAVLSLPLVGVLAILRGALHAYGWGTSRVEAQQSARAALERMAGELREAGYDPTGAGVEPVTAAAPDFVTFQRDLNGNGVVDPTRERVTFLVRHGETVLRRDAGGGAQPIIDGVRRLTLSYYDRTGASVSDPSRVSSIGIRLEVGLSGPVVVMQTQATLRNGRAR